MISSADLFCMLLLAVYLLLYSVVSLHISLKTMWVEIQLLSRPAHKRCHVPLCCRQGKDLNARHPRQKLILNTSFIAKTETELVGASSIYQKIFLQAVLRQCREMKTMQRQAKITLDLTTQEGR